MKLQHQDFFLFAAKAGVLEGFLFGRRKIEPLTNWIENSSRMYRDLSPEVRRSLTLFLFLF